VRLDRRVALVTGAARGIGRALCREFARRGAAGIVVADLDADAARATAAEFGGLGLGCDVADSHSLRTMLADAERHFGRIDLLVSNAGLGSAELDLDDALAQPDAAWQRMWEVHVLAHVRACRGVLPGMLARGSGQLVNVASAAGLLSQCGDAAYSATKHAAVALAESLAITYGDRGIEVGVACPQYVATAMTGLAEDLRPDTVPGVLTVEQAARAIADGIEAGRFLILTHPEVQGYFERKAADYERWLTGMRRVRDGLRSGGFLRIRQTNKSARS
jgi:NAD(P)-dependent dehydrogenase (short-subunit alcohol dehydrogenase family)